MKRWRVLFILFPVFFFWSPVWAAGAFSNAQLRPEPVPEEALSLKEMLVIARKGSPDMEAARARILEAEALFREAGSGLWPVFGVSLAWTKGDAPSSYLFKTIDQRRLPQNVNFNDPGSFNNAEAALWGRMQLYDGGRTGIFRQMADMGRKEAVLGLEHRASHLGAAVVQAFFQVKAAEDYLGIVEESIAAVSRQLEVMEVQYRGGGVLKSDLLSLEVRLAEVMEEKVSSESRLKIASSALSALLGFCPGKGIRPGKADLVLPDMPLEGNAAMALALENRADLKAMKLSVQRSGKAVDAEGRRMLPGLTLQGRYWHHDPDAAFDKNRENWELSLKASWEIFDGFSRKAGKEAALARKAGEEARARGLILEVRQDVEEGLSAVSGAKARYRVARRAVALAGESLDLVRRQYEGGAVDVTRYLQAELDYNRARVRKTAAFYDQERARAELARALGLLSGEV
ncbi:outer membrane protein TolC [Desulfobotulus alkaliphilus]|uniref:Outer membrane protein TolC n=1 Tax=Desulfobotulus alkaliphilus TaxID=622671 RepID=A0A562RFE0_9BACT|nr:TolC family protein [Desulfobotulus alkaliphilus]TWI67787.1 outer membrane protein TolC [Desulfobotulus alkaliphilus]